MLMVIGNLLPISGGRIRRKIGSKQREPDSGPFGSPPKLVGAF